MKTKTIAGIVVLALFVLTIVPLSLAHDVERQSELKVMDIVNVKSEEKIEVKSEEKGEREAQTSIVVGAKQRSSLETRVEGRALKTEVRAKVAEVKAEYKTIREDLADRQEKHREELRALLLLKKEAQECGRGKEEECKSKKAEIKASLKTHLQTTIEVITRSLDQLQERVEDSKVLSAEEKEEALASLNAARVEILAQAEVVSSLAVNASKEEYHAAIKDLQEAWKNAKQVQQWVITQLLNQKLENLVEKHVEYANAMEVRIQSMQQAGADVSQLISIKAEFDLAVKVMQEDLQELDAEWKEFAKSTDKQEHLSDIREAQAQVKKDLQETKIILRAFLQEFQEVKKAARIEVESETETTSAASTTEATANT